MEVHNDRSLQQKTLRVAVLGTRGIPEVMGGIETHCSALYPRLVAKGHRVTIFARKGYVPPAPYSCEGVRIEPLWTPRKKALEAICHTAYGVFVVALKRREYDLLHIHGIGPSLLLPIARILGIRTVMTHHGPDYDRQKWGRVAKFMIRLGERLGCRFADGVITVSRHILGSIKGLYGRDGVYVPNGVTLPDLVASGRMMSTFGLQPGKYILAVGRLVPEKGFHDLLDAYRSVDTEWRLVIAGASDHEDSYSRNLRELAAVDERVVLTGFISGRDLAEVYSNAGLFVLPSYHEGLPIALLEAMSYNLPIIASDIPANRELAEEKETYRVGDIGELRERIEKYLEAPVSGPSKRSRIEQHFNWDLVAEQTEEIYFSIAGC